MRTVIEIRTLSGASQGERNTRPADVTVIGLASLDTVEHRNQGSNRTSSSMGGSTVMRFMRATMSWTLLAAMLLPLSAGSVGHFVCTRGMTQAGPVCPLCHGHVSAEPSGPKLGDGCCKYVAGQPAPDSHLALTHLARPDLGHVPLLAANAGLRVTFERDRMASAVRPANHRTPTSVPLSNFLRL